MYWCAASTPDGNGQMMQEKWKILPFHIQDVHKNNSCQLYPECRHGELEGDAKDRLWLEPGEYIYCTVHDAGNAHALWFSNYLTRHNTDL